MKHVLAAKQVLAAAGVLLSLATPFGAQEAVLRDPALPKEKAAVTTFTATNLGLPKGYYTTAALNEKLFAFAVDESRHGVDLDGNGALDGIILHVHDFTSGTTKSVGLDYTPTLPQTPTSGVATPQTLVGGRRLVTLIPESSIDLNGDGDSFDKVVHLYDSKLDQIQNLGLAVDQFTASGSPLAMSENRLAVLVSEGAQGGLDRNGDGDAIDGVFQIIEFNKFSPLRPSRRSNQLWSAGLALSAFFISTNSRFDGDQLLVGAGEFEQGVDLNGDGDAVDSSVLQYQAMPFVPFVNQGLPVVRFYFASDGSDYAFTVSELVHGRDLNADGDLADDVIHILDSMTGTVSNLGQAVSARRETLLLSPKSVVFLAAEQDIQTDLNGDGDTNDFVLHDYDRNTGVLNNTGLAVEYTVGDEFASAPGDGDQVLFAVSERMQQVDLDGDGVPDDAVLHILDRASGVITNTGYNLRYSLSTESRILDLQNFTLFFVYEDGIDANGNGVRFDVFLFAYDSQANETFDLNLTVNVAPQTPDFLAGVDGDRVAVSIREQDPGIDYNEDGDMSDRVLQLVELQTRTVLNTKLDAEMVAHEDGRLAFLVSEQRQNATDLNGDGDISDLVFHVADWP